MKKQIIKLGSAFILLSLFSFAPPAVTLDGLLDDFIQEQEALEASPLLQAINNQQPETVLQLLEAGADPLQDIFWQSQDDVKEQGKLVHWAAHQGHLDVLHWWVAQELELNVPNQEGLTALIYAAFANQHTSLKLLLEHGADLEHQEKNGGTALMFAAMAGHLEAFQLLLEAGANGEVQTKGWNVLMFAAASGNVRLVSLIQQRLPMLDINSRTYTGYSALMIAAEDNQLEVVKFLLQHGADPQLQNAAGKRPLELAREQNHAEVVDWLEKHLQSH